MAGSASSGPSVSMGSPSISSVLGLDDMWPDVWDYLTVHTSLGTLHLPRGNPGWVSKTQVHPLYSKQYAGKYITSNPSWCNMIMHESTYTRITFMIPARIAPSRYTMCFLRGGSSIRSRNFYAQWEAMCHSWKQRANADTEKNAFPFRKCIWIVLSMSSISLCTYIFYL